MESGQDFDLSTYVYRNARRWQDWIDAQEMTPEAKARRLEAELLRRAQQQQMRRLDSWSFLILVFLLGDLIMVGVLFGII